MDRERGVNGRGLGDESACASWPLGFRAAATEELAAAGAPASS